ncbi:MAG: GntR family transcriptional regulator [Deferribacteraceae bacterium]|nr:GntR family transcriptional regulator [Deferribacteraceae bacterium]
MKNENQTTKIYNSLKQMIISGEYPPLSPLHEIKLSEHYEASRNTVKKALLMLERENLVSIELNKGARVKSVSLEEAKEFLELRAALERFIAQKTVSIISDDDIIKMRSILDTMKQSLQEHKLLEYSQNNQRFHMVIYQACPNKPAVEMTTNIKLQMCRYDTKTILVPGRDVDSFAEHEAIWEAFRLRDSDKAATLTEQHVLNVKSIFEEHFSLLFL